MKKILVKKVFFSVAVMGIIALAMINLNIISENEAPVNLKFSDIEGTTAEYGSLLDMIKNVAQGQGLSKDEREKTEKCGTSTKSKTDSSSITVTKDGITMTATQSSNTTDTTSGGDIERITCPVGEENCTSTSC
jgi:hypothetical protein